MDEDKSTLLVDASKPITEKLWFNGLMWKFNMGFEKKHVSKVVDVGCVVDDSQRQGWKVDKNGQDGFVAVAESLSLINVLVVLEPDAHLVGGEMVDLPLG
ncbi:hypothetical protein Ancab_034225 [Ancistrocladus abbreviatus]